MRIAIDIMGGDHAPEEIIRGALVAAEKWPQHELILVGREEAAPQKMPANCRLHIATEVMGMDEKVDSFMKKKDSSIWQATKLVKDGAADALISAGSTAAQMAAATVQFGRPKGVSRPAIGSVIPGRPEPRVILDIGANVECTPQMMVQFARMGSVYAEILLKRSHPRVALLSNGSEDHKGNELVKESHALLRESGLNFIGNREGRDLFSGDFDVLVFDGYAGNVAVKSAEGGVYAVLDLLKEEINGSLRNKLGALLLKPGLRRIKNTLDYQQLGGGPLLGVKGISIVCHGSSKAKAITNSVGLAATCVELGFTEKIAQALAPRVEAAPAEEEKA